MLIGETITTKDGIVYTCVNRSGTLKKLGFLPWYIRMYLEIRNGILKPLSLQGLGKLLHKYQRWQYMKSKMKRVKF